MGSQNVEFGGWVPEPPVSGQGDSQASTLPAAESQSEAQQSTLTLGGERSNDGLGGSGEGAMIKAENFSSRLLGFDTTEKRQDALVFFQPSSGISICPTSVTGHQ